MMERLGTEQRTKLFNFILKVSIRTFRHKDHIEISFKFEMHLALQQFTDWFGVFGNKGLSVILSVLEDIVQFEMM